MSEVENKETPVENEEKDYVEDGKNKFIVKCKFCGSRILDKKSANYIKLEKDLPLMQQDNNRKEGEIQNEPVILEAVGNGVLYEMFKSLYSTHYREEWRKKREAIALQWDDHG